MTTPCTRIPGWGSLSFGSQPWAGTVYVGGELPSYPPFDVFCLGPCGNLLTVTLYPEVEIGVGDQWTYAAEPDAIHMWSGQESSEQARAYFDVTTGIPDEFSAQWKIRFELLPLDFSDISNRHIHFGAGSHQGYTCGLMVSAAGIAFVPREGTTTGVTPLPGSSGIVVEGETYIVKMVVSAAATYIYVTKFTDYVQYGHILRFVLTSVPASTPPAFLIDKTWFSIKGVYSATPSPGERVSVWIGEYCFSSSLLVSDYPPIADAGPDQAVQYCTIAQMDGSGSRDPEGLTLQYHWRLLGAPPTSGFVLDGLLGHSIPLTVPTGYTTKWYCEQLGTLPVGSILPGDVLVIGGLAYDIAGLDTDGEGDYIQVTLETIPDNLSEQGFVVARQFGISGDTTQKPTFYPDVPGFYKFDLKVYDGAAWSTPSVTVMNVVTSVSPRGIVPDLRFMWEYLTDFWKLVDGRERYTVAWSGLAQFLAAELLNLWQYEYAKSHRDIQRTFQRRWLSYNLRYTLPRGVQSTLRTLFSPYDSDQFLTAGVTGMPGKVVTFSPPYGDAISVAFTAAAGMTDLTAAEIVRQLQKGLPSTYTVVAIAVDATNSFIRITAPYPFSVVGSTAPIFSAASSTGTMQGTSGLSLWNGTAYKIDAGMSLAELGIKENDFLEVDGGLYRIIKTQSSGTGLPHDLVVLKDPLPITASSTWSVPSYFNLAGADFYGQLVTSGDDVAVEVRDALGRHTYYRISSLGAGAGDPTALAVELGLVAVPLFFSSIYTLSLTTLFRRKYTPVHSSTADIPYLQAILTDAEDKNVLRRNLDFFVDTFRGVRCLKFDDGVWVHDEDGVLVPDIYPPATLWAEVTYLDNSSMIEANFGIPVNFTLEDHAALETDVDYLSAVRGLWYSNFNGPILKILRIGTQILLGLPFAEEAGTIQEIRTDYSPNTSRMLVSDASNSSTVRSYVYPNMLGLEANPATGASYAEGDTVEQFAPLVQGIELLDYIKDKKWMDLYAGQGAGSYLHRFFRFLLRVDHGAFTLAAMMFARDFILKIRPTYTYPIFSVLYEADDATVDVTDTVTHRVVFNIFDTPDGLNVAAMYDQPEDGHDSVFKAYDRGPIGQAWKNSFDVGVGWRIGTVDWGYDRVCPRDEVECTMCMTFLAPFTPPMDSIFAYDLPMYDPADPGTPIAWTYDDTLPAGTYCRDKDL